jgi:hypothetical protein
MLFFEDFQEKTTGNLSITFILDVPISALQDLFKDERFKEVPRVPTQLLRPEIIIGPSEMPIAIFKKTKISYVGERYRLQTVGPLREMLELKEIIPTLFEQHKFSLPAMTRYCEFLMPFTPFELPGAIATLRSKINVRDIENFKEVCGCEMQPFRLSLSNLDTPLSDEWFHITLQPDVNRPHDVMLIEIIKRTPKFDEMRKFMDNLGNILTGIKEMLTGG